MLYNNILIPVDFSKHSEHAVQHAVRLASLCAASITLLHVHEIESLTVMDFSYVESPESLDRACAAAEQSLRNIATSIDLSEAQVSIKVITGPAVSTIIEHSAQYDLIVMGTHGRTGLSHLLIGSVAERVVRGAHCSVLTVRPKL